MRNKRAAFVFALSAVILAFFFTIVLVGLTGNSIQLNSRPVTKRTNAEETQYKLLIAILAMALFVMILYMIFFIIYIRVFVSLSTRRSTKR